MLVGRASPDPTPVLHDFLKAAKKDEAFPALKLLALAGAQRASG